MTLFYESAPMSSDIAQLVLQYLKTFMSFEDKRKVRRFRKAAKASALKLMKELNDPLAASLEQMK